MPFLGSPFRIPSCDVADPHIPPSIAQLFHTNAVPSPTDTGRIHWLLEERKAELATFTEEIERARAQVQRLEQQRDQVKQVVLELQALVSPVRRMPTDVMAMIFELCVRTTSPLLLSQVCRAWRYLLFSLPRLWTTLQLDLPSATKDWEALVQSKCLSMHVWLSRSKALPVSLALDHAKGSLIPWHALVHLDKEILSFGSRLKDLSLHFSPRSLSSLLTFTQTPLPHLQHLELRNSNALPTNETPLPVVLHAAPSLKSLSLSWCSLDLHGFQIPWAQLQHLNLEYDASAFWSPVHSDYLKTLASCPNLTTLSLGIGALIYDMDSAHTVTPVTLPHVHTFKTSIYVQTRYLERFFEALHMPQLRRFDIKNVSLALGSFTGQTECLPLLTRCADTLEEVSLNRIDIADSAVLGCLVQLHRLKTLSFLPGILRLNHGLVAALTHEDASGSQGERICPALEALHLRCSSAVPADAIVRLVASRCQTPNKLRQFSLQLATFEYGLDTRDSKIEEVQTQLKKFVEGGLELALAKTGNSG